jgi:hypothetical protein
MLWWRDFTVIRKERARNDIVHKSCYCKHSLGI